ncbi:unnamed protein product [Allacma fusca]|uniref:Protein sleepless n=1 Tax=Allacma fusca TaxID=39272 RepID=A0A8J2KZS4_9HEXA|nr:unnamed protein product [Allacma fusca]
MELLLHQPVTFLLFLFKSGVFLSLLQEGTSHANKTLQDSPESLSKFEESARMYLNNSKVQHLDIGSSSNNSGSDDTDDYLHSGLLESEPNSDSSGSTIPFHKLNRTSHRKYEHERFLSNISKAGINFKETLSDSKALSGVLQSVLGNNHSENLTQDRSNKSSHKIIKKSRVGILGQNRRRKRQVELPLSTNDRKSDWGPTCGAGNADEKITETPVMCYQCRSLSKAEDPGSCDPDQWKYLRKSEKYSLRIRCPENRGHYCVKSVGDKGGGERKTVRGCMGAGPLATKDGKHIALREGCISYIDGDYWTKTCFCKEDLCNGASDHSRESDGSLISAIIVCWAFFIL